MFVINGRFLTQKMTGIQRYAFELCTHLHAIGVDFLVAVPQEINPDYRIPFNLLRIGSLKNHLWEQWSLARYLKKNGSPLLVNFSGSGVLNYPNQIMTIHDLAHERHPEWFSKNYVRYYHFMMPRVARNARAVVTVSEFSKQEITTLFDVNPEKIFVVPNGVSLPIKETKSSPKPEKYIVAISSLEPRKNFGRLIQAFLALKTNDVKLCIAGMKFKSFRDLPFEEWRNENVIFPGYLSDIELVNLYENALFSVYPSLYEGFGLPPLESMACRCPVLASRIPPVEQVCGNAVLYTDPLNISQMAAQMELLIRDPKLREELILKGTERVKKYSWKTAAVKFLELLKTVLP